VDKLPDADESQAVFVAVESYDALEPLPATRRNVVDLVAVLQSRRHWGIPPGNTQILDESCSPQEIDAALGRATRHVGPNGILLFYFAGHGLIDAETGDLYLAVRRTDPEAPHATALPYWWVRRSLRRSVAAQRLVILDCCYAGRAEMGPAMSIAGSAYDDGDHERTCLLAATSRNRVALAPLGAVHTAFSGQLISTLKAGVEGGPAVLDVDLVWRQVTAALRAKGYPTPEMRESNGWRRGSSNARTTRTPRSPKSCMPPRFSVHPRTTHPHLIPRRTGS
jgi:putative transcriptional regulator